MTITIFLGSLMGAMALGMPIAFALLISGVALMLLLACLTAKSLPRICLTGRTASRSWPSPSLSSRVN